MVRRTNHCGGLEIITISTKHYFLEAMFLQNVSFSASLKGFFYFEKASVGVRI